MMLLDWAGRGAFFLVSWALLFSGALNRGQPLGATESSHLFPDGATWQTLGIQRKIAFCINWVGEGKGALFTSNSSIPAPSPPGLKGDFVSKLRAKNITSPTSVQVLTLPDADIGWKHEFLVCGHTRSSSTQIAAIPRVLQRKDAAIQCYTGSGKTLAYLLPLLTLYYGRGKKTSQNDISQAKSKRQRKDVRSPGAAAGACAIVIAPTRELAMQIAKEAEYLGGPGCVQQIIGGTPGRLFDHIEKGGLHLSKVDTVVLDEADELLSESPRNNYLQHLKDIMTTVRAARVPKHVNLLLVSASISPSIIHRAHVDMGLPQMRKVASEQPKEQKGQLLFPHCYLVIMCGARLIDASIASASRIASGDKEGGSDAEPLSLPPGVRHFVVFSHDRHRSDMTRRVLHAVNASRALVFVNYDKQVKDVVFKIQRLALTVATRSRRDMYIGVLNRVSSREGLSMSWLEGSMRKAHRREQLDKFRQGVVRALVVVNLHAPRDVLNYVHRAGRTGRLGRAGTVVTILSQRDRVVLKKLRRSLSHIEIVEVHVKNGTLHHVQAASSS
eukprot:jgi/Bigna1/89318/estExt_fgenesh1_pg.C_470032